MTPQMSQGVVMDQNHLQDCESKAQFRPDTKAMYLARPGQSFRLSRPASWVDPRPGLPVTFLLPQMPWKIKQTLVGRGPRPPLNSPVGDPTR